MTRGTKVATGRPSQELHREGHRQGEGGQAFGSTRQVCQGLLVSISEVESRRLPLRQLLQRKLDKMRLLRQRPKRNRRPSPRQRLMLHLFSLHRNRSSMLKGKAKEREHQGATVDRRHGAQKIRRRFRAISTLSRSHARREKDCEFSHDQKVFDNCKKDGEGKGKSKSPRRRTPSNTPKKIDEPCWNWAKGKCKYGDSCRRRHDLHLFNTAPNTSEPASPALVRDFDSDDDAVICYKAASTTKSKEKVRFDMKKTDQVQYKKYNFVQCERKSPRFKSHNKIGKSSEELKKDEQWVYTNRLATVRAKAMAIILSNVDDYVNVDEVHIVIGPKTDIKIRMVSDGEGDVDEQVFIPEHVQHVPGKFGMKGNVMCITVPVEETDKKVYHGFWQCAWPHCAEESGQYGHGNV